MRIDLKDPEDFTIDNVRKLLGGVDDSVRRQYKVTKDGFLYITDDCSDHDISDHAFVGGYWIEKRGYTGADAANDQEWVEIFYKTISENWPEPSCEKVPIGK